MIRGFLIDLDGVLYTGETPVTGAGEAIRFLEEAGYSCRFVSNTTRRSRVSIAEKLSRMGLAIPASFIFTPAVAATAYMKKTKKERFRLMVTGDSRADFPQGAGTAGDAAPDYVIVGDAGDEFTYGSLNTAFRDLMNGSDLIALEKDRYWMDTDGLSLSAGPFVSALEYATGKTAVLMGKPSAAYFELALGDMGVRQEEAVMIGDDIRTDVGGAQASGMRAVLVRTGKYRDDVLAGSGITPDLVIDSVAMVRRVIEADQGNRWRRRV